MHILLFIFLFVYMQILHNKWFHVDDQDRSVYMRFYIQVLICTCNWQAFHFIIKSDCAITLIFCARYSAINKNTKYYCRINLICINRQLYLQLRHAISMPHLLNGRYCFCKICRDIDLLWIYYIWHCVYKYVCLYVWARVQYYIYVYLFILIFYLFICVCLFVQYSR